MPKSKKIKDSVKNVPSISDKVFSYLKALIPGRRGVCSVRFTGTIFIVITLLFITSVFSKNFKRENLSQSPIQSPRSSNFHEIFRQDVAPGTSKIHAVVLIDHKLDARTYAGDTVTFRKVVGKHELLQWIEYMKYAGIFKLHVYETWRYSPKEHGESLQHWAGSYRSDFLTYNDWRKPENEEMFTPENVLKHAHEQILGNFKDIEDHWMYISGIEDYVFSYGDKKHLFLTSIVNHLQVKYPNAVEFTMNSYDFSGPKKGSIWMIERLNKKFEEMNLHESSTLMRPMHSGPSQFFFAVSL